LGPKSRRFEVVETLGAIDPTERLIGSTLTA
jgi:hypothetical protein